MPRHCMQLQSACFHNTAYRVGGHRCVCVVRPAAVWDLNIPRSLPNTQEVRALILLSISSTFC
jgi:hypothetical protein